MGGGRGGMPDLPPEMLAMVAAYRADIAYHVEAGGVRPFGGDIDEYRDGLAERLAKVYEDDVEEGQGAEGLDPNVST